MLKCKDLSSVQKAGLVICSVSYAVYMICITKAIKHEMDEINELSNMIAQEAIRYTKGL